MNNHLMCTLCNFHFEKKDITKDYWVKHFLNHHKKAGYFTNLLLEQRDLSRDKYGQATEGVKDTAITYNEQVSSQYEDIFKQLNVYTDNFNKLKLLCFYSNWDKTNER